VRQQACISFATPQRHPDSILKHQAPVSHRMPIVVDLLRISMRRAGVNLP
jgi:hypothetical protein